MDFLGTFRSFWVVKVEGVIVVFFGVDRLGGRGGGGIDKRIRCL